MTQQLAVSQHFVTFLTPGALVSNPSTRPIDRWDVTLAVNACKEMACRTNRMPPYAFFFTTRGRTTDELDSRETARSGRYFIHGRIETLQEVEDRADPGDNILLDNMRVNRWTKVVRNFPGYPWTTPLQEGDVVLGRETTGTTDVTELITGGNPTAP